MKLKYEDIKKIADRYGIGVKKTEENNSGFIVEQSGEIVKKLPIEDIKAQFTKNGLQSEIIIRDDKIGITFSSENTEITYSQKKKDRVSYHGKEALSYNNSLFEDIVFESTIERAA